jgi:hypothetical integral membrane protein (TIGR02206 family)
MDSFLFNNNNFQPSSTEHVISVLIFTLIGLAMILYGSRLRSQQAKRTLLLYFSFGIFLSQLAKVGLMLIVGTFDATRDLPFHLCNIAPIILWTAYYLNNRKVWGVIFLWIMAGTLQANFTPTLEQSFPHFEWFRYWIIHVWLVIALLYGMVNLGYRLRFMDIFRSLLWLNVFAAVIYPVNLLLDANYLYLMQKPDGRTLFDLLGNWPVYILQIELVAILLFSLLYLPFYLNARMVRFKGKV